MEFNITTDLKKLPCAIEFNFEELKSELAPRLDFYNKLVVTEDSIRAAKSDKAALNKLKTAIEDKRKEVKKACLAPYESFEKQCRELIAMIDEPITAIDSQVKNFENEKKKRKYSELEEYWFSLEKLSFVELKDVLNPKWSNAAMSVEKLKDEIRLSNDRINSEYSTLNEKYKDSPLRTAVLNKFSETKDLSPTLVYALTLEAELKKEQEQKEKESTPVQKSSGIPEGAKITEPIRQTVSEPEKIVGGCFAIKCEKSKLIALKAYMENSGIEIIGTMTLKEFNEYKSNKN